MEKTFRNSRRTMGNRKADERRFLILVTTLVIMLCVLFFFIGRASACDYFWDDSKIYTMDEVEQIAIKKNRPDVQITLVKAEEEFVPKSYYMKEIPLDSDVQSFMRMVCKEFKVSYAMALAFMESESSFRADAEGDSGSSIGYMQINRPNWDRYGLDAAIPYDNIEIGVRMIAELIDKYQDFDAVVMAYKGGESKADRWIQEGFRLSACDELIERANYWQSVIDLYE